MGQGNRIKVIWRNDSTVVGARHWLARQPPFDYGLG